jgi:hypothetical protein
VIVRVPSNDATIRIQASRRGAKSRGQFSAFRGGMVELRSTELMTAAVRQRLKI